MQADLARIAALEKQLERLLSPLKTPDNSSLPPLKGQKPNRPDKPASKAPRQGSLGRKGGGRALTVHPGEGVVTEPTRCQCCHTTFGDDDHTLDARYDKIDLPQVRPVVRRVERHSGTCRGCGAVTLAAVPEGLEPGTPFSITIMALAPVTTDAQRLRRRYGKVRSRLLTFLDHPEITADNNSSERELRPTATYRKVTGGFRSGWGAEFYPGIRSVIGTAKRCGMDAYQAINATLRGQTFLPVG